MISENYNRNIVKENNKQKKGQEVPVVNKQKYKKQELEGRQLNTTIIANNTGNKDIRKRRDKEQITK